RVVEVRDQVAAQNSFTAAFGGSNLVAYFNDTAHTAWTPYSFTVAAAANNPVLEFIFYNPPAFDYLDDVSVCISPACRGVCVGGSPCESINSGFETGLFAGWTQFGT